MILASGPSGGPASGREGGLERRLGTLPPREREIDALAVRGWFLLSRWKGRQLYSV
jgi:hypothetical protein